MFKFLNKISFLLKKKRIFFIDSKEDWNFFISKLKKEKLIGIDTEFDWRTTYLPKLCLIQISTIDEIFILDCLALDNFYELKLILEDMSILKIFHAVRSDSTVLSKCLNIYLKNVYDIQQAEKLINEGDIFSYGSIINKYLNISLDKNETNSNWLRRPLSKSQLKYAAEDVDHLIKIYNFQKKTFSKKEIDKVMELSEKESSLGKEDLAKSRLKKKINKLTGKEKEIFSWREQIAKIEDVPPNYIFKEKHIAYLASISQKDSQFLKKNLLKILGDSKYVAEFISEFG